MSAHQASRLASKMSRNMSNTMCPWSAAWPLHAPRDTDVSLHEVQVCVLSSRESRLKLKADASGLRV